MDNRKRYSKRPKKGDPDPDMHNSKDEKARPYRTPIIGRALWKMMQELRGMKHDKDKDDINDDEKN